jgi:hypothetical protein
MRISGTVKDPSKGVVLAGAKLSLNLGQAELAVLYSDDKGRFEYKPNAPYIGETLVCRVEKENYQHKEITRYIRQEEVKLDIELLPEMKAAASDKTNINVPSVSKPGRFSEVEQHPDYQNLMNMTPSTIRQYVKVFFYFIFGLIFTAIALVMSGFVTKFFKPFAILPVTFILIGIGIILWSLVRFFRFIMGTLTRETAKVVDKRIRVRGGGSGHSATTSYYITLEFRSGDRKEYPTEGNTYGGVTHDDIGVAYIKGGILLDYRRLPV